MCAQITCQERGLRLFRSLQSRRVNYSCEKHSLVRETLFDVGVAATLRLRSSYGEKKDIDVTIDKAH
jgi:hypothetical protein